MFITSISYHGTLHREKGQQNTEELLRAFAGGEIHVQSNSADRVNHSHCIPPWDQSCAGKGVGWLAIKTRVPNPFSKPTSAGSAALSHGNQLLCTQVNGWSSSLPAALGLGPATHSP